MGGVRGRIGPVVLGAGALILALHGCRSTTDVQVVRKVRRTEDGTTVVEKHSDQVTVNGVRLSHQRTVEITSSLDPMSTLDLGSGWGDIRVESQAAAGCHLSVQVWESSPDDVDVAFQNGRIEAASRTGSPYLLGTLTARLGQAQGCGLVLTSVSGDIHVKDLDDLSALEIRGAMGNVSCENVEAEDLGIKLSTGNIDVRGVKSRSLNARAAQGEITITSLSAEKARVETDSGDIQMREGGGIELRVRSSLGKVDLRGGKWESMILESASGDVSVGDVKMDRLEIETTTGSVRLEGIEGKSLRVRSSSGDIDGGDVNVVRQDLKTTLGKADVRPTR